MEEKDWEYLLYAKIYTNFQDLRYLQQYERCSVQGVVRSVSILNKYLINIFKIIYIFFNINIYNSIIFKLQFDKNDTMCTFRLDNNGFQIRLTVWRTELGMVDKLGKFF